MSAEEITNACGVMSAQLQQVQTALAAGQTTNANLRPNTNRGGESGGIVGANRRGQMKEISTKKYTDMQVSGMLQVLGQGHERLRLLARQFDQGAHRVLRQHLDHGPESYRTKRSGSAVPAGS